MKVERVNSDALAEISKWREAWGFPEWPARWLSPLGYWVPGIAAGWLVTTNSGRALIEDFISSKSASDDERGRALFAIEREIANKARAMGFDFLIGTTQLQSVRERVRIAGYTVTAPKYSLHKKDLA